MSVTVNNVAIDDEQIEAEAIHHASACSPRLAAMCALAIRELLLQRAEEVGLTDRANAQCDAAIDKLLEREAAVPAPTENEARRYYESHRERFVTGELVEASHILFAVTPEAPVEAIRRQAESVLRQALADPHRFGELAQRFSNCPSGARGGNLGQLGRGDVVPEFERAIFGAPPGILPRIVNTRYGFHILNIVRHVPGHVPAFEVVRPRIERDLKERVRIKAAEQYVRVLAAKASVVGVDLRASESALMQ